MSRARNSGSANAGPWQVKGVGNETREAVRRAARKAGMPIGEWVDRTLHRVATEELTGSASLPVKIEDTLRDVLEKLTGIEERQRLPWWKRFKSGS